MSYVGIEAMNVFGGTAYIDVRELVDYRGLDPGRFRNLLMKEKAVAMVHEDPITFAVNAAKPIIDTLTAEEKSKIDLVITCSESGIDFGKSMSTYIHDYLGLENNCRLFEIKQACYSATAGFQMASNSILSQTAPGSKALVIATDIARLLPVQGDDGLSQDWAYAEPSTGAGAVAILVGSDPTAFDLDIGAAGYYGYEVMDTCRPVPDGEAGNADLSLLSYLDCCENAFANYCEKVENVDYRDAFNYLAFHTPFGGMVKGAHRAMMRKTSKSSPAEIENDFNERVYPGLLYCQRVGNIMGGSVFLSLASIIDHADATAARRIGCFSYGSGCCSEFFSGIVSAKGQARQKRFAIGETLSRRHKLSMSEYDNVLQQNLLLKFGARNEIVSDDIVRSWPERTDGQPRLYLRRIKDFHREYEWVL